jgi:hypothetical protein
MVKMQRFGFFREHFSEPSGLISIREAQMAARKTDSMVTRYLDESPTVADFTEASECLLGCEEILSGCSSVKTDGQWVWRADSSHYVRVHGLLLPTEFIKWGEMRQWVANFDAGDDLDVARRALRCAWS